MSGASGHQLRAVWRVQPYDKATDMPMPVFDTQDAIPEAFRGEYVEREDPATPGVKKWYPNVEDVSGLKNALQSQKDAAKAAKEAREAAERERDELKRTQDARAAGISDDQLSKIRADEEAARKPFIEQAEKFKAENRKLKLDDRALKLFLDKGGRPESAQRAMRDLNAQGRLDLSDADNIVIKDATGNVTTETPEHFFATTYKAEALEFYKGSGASGSGATGTTTYGGTPSSYDPVKAGKAMAQQQKVSGADNLAFK